MAAKGYDDSPPRNGIIFFYTVLTVFMLIGVKFLLDSYFANMMDVEVYEKVLTVGLDEVKQKRAKEQEQLEKGAMPIERAMKTLAQRGRGASPLLAPQSGQGMQPIAGWSQLKRELPPAPPPAVEPPVGSAPVPGITPVAPEGRP